MRRIEQVSCSLNLGLIYNVNYSWSPDNGVEMTIYFVNTNGTYTQPALMQKAFVRLGGASFSLYVVASKISLSSGRRVIQVTFVDEFFKLNNYWVCLTGKGCGYNVFPLGRPVDRRTDAQKLQDSLDRSAQQIADFTQFPDIEYTFNDFLTVLRSKFNVSVNANYDRTATNIFSGTFREVLSSWCSFFNLSFFFENGTIKIFNPSSLFINLPSRPADCIEYEEEQDARDTYSKTCFNWFQQEGGQFNLNQAGSGEEEDASAGGPLLVRTDTLFPIGYEYNLPQTYVDLNQAAAAQYGMPFWFLYNYAAGSTAANCGWTPLDGSAISSLNIANAVRTVVGGVTIAAVNQSEMEQKYDMYFNYGNSIAGRWYLSNEKSNLAIDENYQWFDEAEGQIFNFNSPLAASKAMDLLFLTPTNSTTNTIDGTSINKFYQGVNYVGNRIAYKVNTPIPTGTFALTEAQASLVNSVYQSIIDVKGSSSVDFNSDLAPVYGTQNTYVAYQPITIPQELRTIFATIPTKAEALNPQYTSIPIKGITRQDYSTLKASKSEPDKVDVVKTDNGPSIIGNTAVIKTLKQGAYSIYYDKYEKCASAHSSGPYFQHRFEPRQISTDNTVTFNFIKSANNTYSLTRDYATINALVNNPFLPTLAQARSFPTKRISFTVNYFRDVPGNFLTNGLVSMSISVDGNGVTCSYTFSNEVLQVPYPENDFAKYEQMIRNSAVRQYNPTTVIS